MSLPMNATPIYTLTVPSTKKEFKYRPFLVKDEKALLVAQQSEDTTVMLDTIKSVIISCAKSQIDVDKLATFDIEYIFTQMRAVSVGELVDLIFACDDCTVDAARVKMTLNLQDMKVVVDPEHTPNIKLFEEVGVMMKYPTIDTLKKVESSDVNNMNQMQDLMVDCMSYIYDGDEIFHAHEQTPEELSEFIDNLTSEQYQKVQQFFRTMPTLRQDIQYKCPVCNKQHNKYLEGLSSFF